MQNLERSLFSLVKYNAGFFKSAKQRDFLVSKLGYDWIVTHNYQFGEFEKATRNNTAQVDYRFFMDDRGIYKVLKTTSKRETVWFERGENAEQYSEKKRNELEARKRFERLDKLRSSVNKRLFKLNKLCDENITAFLEASKNGEEISDEHPLVIRAHRIRQIIKKGEAIRERIENKL